MQYDIIIGRNIQDRKKFGEEGTVFLGKHYVRMGQTTSLSNRVMLDVIRPHVILIDGKRGSGKCLVGDTLITLEDGSVVPIKELQNDPREVYGLNEKLKITKLKKTDFFKREVDKIISLRLRSGKELKITPEHPLLTIRGWIPVEELSIGSRIATPRKIDCFGKDNMDEHKLKLLAYLIAEGHTMKGGVLFSNTDQDIIKEFKECVKKFDHNLKISLHGHGGYRISNKNNRYGFRKNLVKDWLRSLNLYNLYAKEKWIPQEIFRLPREGLKIFLNRLFSCDGSIYNNKSRNGWEIDYSSSSKKLIYNIHHLLLRFGILSRIRSKKVRYNGVIYDSFELVLNPENCIKFIENIGFFGRKKIIQERCLKEIIRITRNPNIDTIPKEVWNFYRPDNWARVGRAFGYAHPKAMRERIKYSPSRETLLQISEIEESNILYLLATSDIFWDEIISMELLEGNFDVYDISVPDYHNFIANDVIVHNSYTMMVMVEGMASLPKEIALNLSILVIDTMGIFWTMKFPNQREEDLLAEWNLSPKPLEIDIYTPEGFYKEYRDKGIPTENKFSIKTSELTSEDWGSVFNVTPTDPIGIAIERALTNLEAKKDFSIKDIINMISNDKRTEKKVKDAAENLFLSADSWGLFSQTGTEIRDLTKPGRISVLDVSVYSNISGNWGIKSLVIGLIAKKLLAERMTSRKLEELESIKSGQHLFQEEEKREMPLIWMFLDEGHEVLPKNGQTAATDPLVQLLREGRQPGISLVIATQQPGEIHTDVITQSDIIISHRITAKRDIEALNNMMQTYLTADIQKYLNELPHLKGSAIVLDDNSERIYPMRVRPRLSWHGGESPTAIKEKKKALLDLGI